MENVSSRGSGEASEWTGEKRTKIQSTPTAGDSSGGQEQIQGLDWDDGKLSNEIDSLLKRLNDGPPDDDDDEESLAFCDEQQLKALNQRLALCRVRAHEEKYRGMDDASLLAQFPPSDLEDNWYYKRFELGLQWRFNHVYCHYTHLQDYHRLMLTDNGEYEYWEYYYRTCSTLDGL